MESLTKILMINPATRVHDKPKHVPYGILQLIAILNRDHPDIDVKLYDDNAYRDDQRLTEALQEQYDVVAVGGLITAYSRIKKIVNDAKQYSPDCKVVVGGGFFTSMPEEMMRWIPEVDYGVVGEAYVSLPNLLNCIHINGDVSQVKGLVYRDGATYRQTSLQPLIPDLDWLPYPAYDYAPLDIYFKNSSILMSKESMNSKRRLDCCFSLGCIFTCRMCWDLGITSNTVKNGRPGKHTLHRHHSPKYVAEMIQYLYEKYQVDQISWLDENIVVHDAKTNFTWLKEIESELEARGLLPEQLGSKAVFHGGTSHAGLIKRETLRTMKRIGFTYLDYGLESFDDGILKSLGKGSTAELNKKAVQMTLEEGIQPIPNMIIGFPDESWESIGKMLDAWEETGIVSKPFICSAYPGSKWFKEYRDRILQQYNGDLEQFILDLGDATKVTALLTDRFTPVEMIGIQNILAESAKSGDFKTARRLFALSKKSSI